MKKINDTIKNLQLKLIGTENQIDLKDGTTNPVYFFKGWSFILNSKNQMTNDYKILANNERITEAYLLPAKYIKNEDDFIKECKRFYINRLEGM